MMREKDRAIPVNVMTNESGSGISIERIVFSDDDISGVSVKTPNEAHTAHRHDVHSFFLLEQGAVNIDIDFQHYTITAPSVIYIHPDQVHRTLTTNDIIVSSLAITDENLNAEYLKLLESIVPAKPVNLNEETYSLIADAVALSLKLAERRSNKLHHFLLKDSCNTLVALIISQYTESTEPAVKSSRFEIINKEFRTLLERNYSTIKSPAGYAQKLNISAPYLNECVKNITGHPVSYHIQQRVILEAKRLLYHSGKSVKEIAAALGYNDYPYFSRLFTRVTCITALAFRNKKFD